MSYDDLATAISTVEDSRQRSYSVHGGGEEEKAEKYTVHINFNGNQYEQVKFYSVVEHEERDGYLHLLHESGHNSMYRLADVRCMTTYNE